MQNSCSHNDPPLSERVHVLQEKGGNGKTQATIPDGRRDLINIGIILNSLGVWPGHDYLDVSSIEGGEHV